MSETFIYPDKKPEAMNISDEFAASCEAKAKLERENNKRIR